MKVKPRKLKVSGLPSPRCSRSAAAWRPNSIRRVFSGWSDSANSSRRAHHVEEPTGVGLVFEADDGIIRITEDDHVACCLPLSPAVGPEVEGVVQVDVGKQR